MENFTVAELKIIAALLKKAANEFSNHSCNDFIATKEAGINKEESDDLWLDLAKWDDKELIENIGRECHYDWMLMRYFADKIKKNI